MVFKSFVSSSVRVLVDAENICMTLLKLFLFMALLNRSYVLLAGISAKSYLIIMYQKCNTLRSEYGIRQGNSISKRVECSREARSLDHMKHRANMPVQYGLRLLHAGWRLAESAGRGPGYVVVTRELAMMVWKE
jgi:hypothetical protein